MENQNVFNWLHLCDFHRSFENHDCWSTILEKFYDDLYHLCSKCGHLDMVLLTGDLTLNGTKEEFSRVDEFLTALWEKLSEWGMNPKLLAVPGNHDLLRPDLDRHPELKSVMRDFAQWNTDEEVRSDFWKNQNPVYRNVLNAAYENYLNWWQNQKYRVETVTEGILPGDFSVSISIKGVNIGIVGLNSAFLQITDKNDSSGSLTLHTRQFNAVTGDNGPKWIKQHHACLLMTHHPRDFLNLEGKTHLKYDIWNQNHFALHVCGHLHSPIYEDISHTDQHIWQGRSFVGKEYVDQPPHPRLMGYAVGQMRFSRGDQTGIMLHWPRVIDISKRSIYSDSPSFTLADEHTLPKEFKLIRTFEIDSGHSDKEPPESEKENEKKSHPETPIDEKFESESKTSKDEKPTENRAFFESSGFDFSKLDRPIAIFVSYAREDDRLMEELRKQFAILENHSNKITIWCDKKLFGGDDWEKEIDERIHQAHVILLLLSPDFFTSDWCKKEMEIALHRQETGDGLVIPVSLRHVANLKMHPVSKLSILPDPKTPLVSKIYQNIPSEGFAIVAEGIVKAIEKSLGKLKKLPVVSSRELKDYIEFEQISQPLSLDNGEVQKTYQINKKPLKIKDLNTILDLNLTGLDYYQAVRYAHWLGGRLPTRDEWEYCYKKKSLLPYPNFPEWLQPENETQQVELFQNLMKIEKVAGRFKNFTMNQRVDEGRENYALRLVKDIINKQ